VLQLPLIFPVTRPMLHQTIQLFARILPLALPWPLPISPNSEWCPLRCTGRDIFEVAVVFVGSLIAFVWIAMIPWWMIPVRALFSSNVRSIYMAVERRLALIDHWLWRGFYDFYLLSCDLMAKCFFHARF